MNTAVSFTRPGEPPSVDVFRAIADPTRRALLDLLRTSDRSVSELAEPFQMTQPAISQHLRVLRQAGLVRPKQVGRQRVYRLNARPLREVRDWAVRYDRFWQAKPKSPGEYLDR
jgi:DNA-binding transcriptional ArsR family regulator